MKGMNNSLLEELNKKIITPELLYMIEKWLKSKKLVFEKIKNWGVGPLKALNAYKNSKKKII